MKQNIGIDQIFNDCLEEVASGRATVASCLERYPEYAAELESLLLTSLDISRAAAVAPPAGARMRIRYALNERMAELSRRQAKPFWRFGWANAVATFVMGLTLAGGGVAYAASGAMPDQVLYPLKLSLEEALVSLPIPSGAKLDLYTALNDRRVAEIVYLAGKGDAQTIIEVVSRIENNFTAAAAIKTGSTDSGMLTMPSFGPEKSQDATIAGSPEPPNVVQPPGASVPVTARSSQDASLADYANQQLDTLSNTPAGGSAAVQAALEKAIAAVRNGYDWLLSIED
ncbi:DUF5667 domain-containing protein [Dehalogenimonas sp. 4OHTPN]|uniref:DUF5667 domain-containing protein n=1 Tax=Dehalogenimonas sp. 4OHTPN TaxID=3166643 RepID=A0AAU8G9M4_9CHLR